MSRFIGNRGIIDNLSESGNFAMTGELVVPTSPSAGGELVALSSTCTLLDPGTKRTQCVLTVFEEGRCQSAGGGANPLYCTWTVPASVQRVTVQMWGAGGGGGRGCGPAGRGVGVPGGGGGFAQFNVAVVPGETYCLKAGAAGTGQTYGGQGCRGECTCMCRVGGGLTVSATGGGGGPACRDCYGAIGNSGAYGGTVSIADTTCMVGCCNYKCGQRTHGSGPYCACGYTCRSTNQRGGNAFMGGQGAQGHCKGCFICPDSGGNWAKGWGGGGAGGTGHGSGSGMYSTPCCRGGRGGPGMILIWM